MKNAFKILILISLFSLFSCVVSRNEYENVLYENNLLKKQVSELTDELELFKYGEERLITLIRQSWEIKNITEARKNVNLLLYYHPQSNSNNEVRQLITLIENEENREKVADLAKRQGFQSDYALNAEILDVLNASFLADSNKLIRGKYYILSPARNGLKQNDTKIGIYSLDNQSHIYARSDVLYNWLNANIPIKALVRYNGGDSSFDQFTAIEVIRN